MTLRKHTFTGVWALAALAARGCIVQRTSTNEDDDDVLTSPGGSRYDEAGDGELQTAMLRTSE